MMDAADRSNRALDGLPSPVEERREEMFKRWTDAFVTLGGWLVMGLLLWGFFVAMFWCAAWIAGQL